MQRIDIRIVVAIGASLLVAEATRWTELPRAAGVAIALGLGVLLAMWTRSAVLQPLVELRDGLRALRSGTRQRARPDATSEVGALAASIDREANALHLQLEQVSAERQQLEAVLGAMVEGVLVLDRHGYIALANPRLRELLDVWSEVEGRRPLEVVRNPDIDAALREAATSETVVVHELEAIGPDRRTLLMHASRIPGEETGASAVAVFHDVSEIRRLEQIRRDFLANASHELRTPLTSIRGYAETLLGGSPDAATGSALEAILRNAQRLGALIDDLLALSRIEGRREPMQLTEIDVSHVAGLLADDAAPRLREAQLELKLALAPVSMAWADQGAVEQVIGNLLDNAIKYTPAGGRITLSVEAQGHGVVVRVADTGMGIPDEDQARIFERFFRVDRARSRALGGTGLGLSIVKHLVQAMGGDIFVESELGRGSTFELRLPPVRDHDAAAGASA